MYVIIVYDVASERNSKILKLLRKHLDWVQNSVFEGEVTKAELEELTSKLQNRSSTTDSIIIYTIGSEDYVDKTVIGEEKGNTGQIL